MRAVFAFKANTVDAVSRVNRMSRGKAVECRDSF